MVAEAGKRILPEAVAWLTDNLGTDRMVTRGEIAKLLLYNGEDAPPISLDDCVAVVGDSSTMFLYFAAFASFVCSFSSFSFFRFFTRLFSFHLCSSLIPSSSFFFFLFFFL